MRLPLFIRSMIHDMVSLGNTMSKEQTLITSAYKQIKMISKLDKKTRDLYDVLFEWNQTHMQYFDIATKMRHNELLEEQNRILSALTRGILERKQTKR